MDDAPPLPEPGTTLGGLYVLHRLLGQGGMGAVFEAERGGERFAVKVLLSGSKNPELFIRFLREGKAAASLDTPYIVPVLDTGFDARLDAPYLVMPLLRGRDLASRLEGGPLHPTVAARLIAQAASGVMVAHRAGVIHRDLKPANLFLDERDGIVTVRVCDFGLAKVTEHQQATALTGTGVGLGSVRFMPPEQFRDAGHVDTRADLWALGMSLYNALTGVVPFAGINNITDVFVQVATQDMPPIQDAAPWVEPGLARLFHGLIIRDKELRCPSAQALLDALMPLTDGSLVVTEAMLAPLPDDLRRHVAPRVNLPARWESGADLDATSPALDPRVGQQVGGRFRLRRLIGRGGMGDVYEASDASGEAVAVKVMSPALGQDAAGKRRFVREVRAAMAIQSPHVVRVIDADSDATHGVPYMAMELLRGTDLAHLLRTAGPLEPAATCRAFVQACEGLAAAHALGIVHRDIKPANLFLHEQEGGEIAVKICDFGVAKSTDVSATEQTTVDLTRTGGLVGSPLYMSPEQARSARDIDARTDLWSLCVSLYEALSGKNPWGENASVGDIIIAICTTDAVPLQRVAPWVDAGLAQAVHRGLQRSPGQRWGSAAELAAALRPFCSDLPPSRESLASLSPETRSLVAPPPPDEPEPGPLPRRSSPGLAVVAAVAVVGLGFGGVAALRDGPQGAPPRASALATVKACPGEMIRHESGSARLQGGEVVEVAAFCLDRSEVTAGAYDHCLAERRCADGGTSVDWPRVSDDDRKKWGAFCNGHRPDRSTHPINCLSALQASAYCVALGKRLPSEAELALASAGKDGRLFPWGAAPVGERACWSGIDDRMGSKLGTCPVGLRPDGASPLGVLDLAGNVAEWALVGGDGGAEAIAIGGGWSDDDDKRLRSGASERRGLLTRSSTIGFRCAYTPGR